MPGKSSSVERVIRHFGGQNAMARVMGLRQSTVFGWSVSGRIPQQRWNAIKRAALKLSPPVTLTAADFFDDEDEPIAQSAAA